MWWEAVKFGGDSGAMRQVSDIETGFGRLSSTAGSRWLSWNRCQGINLRLRPSRTAVPSGLAAVAAASRHRRRAGQGRDQIRFALILVSVSAPRPADARVPGEPARPGTQEFQKVRAENSAVGLDPGSRSRVHRHLASWRSLGRDTRAARPGMSAASTQRRPACRYFNTRSTCRISLKGTAECSMPLPADWPSPLTV